MGIEASRSAAMMAQARTMLRSKSLETQQHVLDTTH